MWLTLGKSAAGRTIADTTRHTCGSASAQGTSLLPRPVHAHPARRRPSRPLRRARFAKSGDIPKAVGGRRWPHSPSLRPTSVAAGRRRRHSLRCSSRPLVGLGEESGREVSRSPEAGSRGPRPRALGRSRLRAKSTSRERLRGLRRPNALPPEQRVVGRQRGRTPRASTKRVAQPTAKQEGSRRRRGPRSPVACGSQRPGRRCLVRDQRQGADRIAAHNEEG